MARSVKPVEEVTENVTAAPKEGKQESVYTVEELVKAHKAFDAPYEIVAVALKLAGVKTATEAEARKIIDTFKKQEVK